jgi:peptidoglycan/LPS O-acetylase OafA/YrhL
VSLFNETNLLNMRKFIYFLSKYSYGSFLFHHVFIDNLILHYKFNIYSKKISSLFFLVSLICIYSVSYILTNFTEYFLLSRNKKAI